MREKFHEELDRAISRSTELVSVVAQRASARLVDAAGRALAAPAEV